MNLNESVATLKTLLPNLKANDASFAASLIASFTKYGSLTPKQAPWIGKLIDRAQTPAFQVVASSPAPVAIKLNPDVNTPVFVGDFAGVVNLFTVAKAKLKFPKISLSLNGKTLRLALLGSKSKNAGAVSITDGGKYPHSVWYGRVNPEGTFVASSNNAPEFTEALTALLTEFAKHPARVAKAHGKLTGNCCFCNKDIGKGKDKRSAAVGFGPDCAENYGLLAEWKAGVAKAEAGITQVPTLSAEISMAAAGDDLAASLKACTGAVSVTVTDTDSITPEMTAAVNADIIAAVNEQTAIDEVLQGIEAEATAKIEAITKAEAITAFEASYTGPSAATLAKLDKAPMTCFICNKTSADYQVLHSHTVCGNCVKQLV